MWHYVYILISQRDGRFYSGYTENLKSRFEKHCKGDVESTRNRRPLKLVYSEVCLNKQDAMRREKYFKTYHGKQFLYKRLKSYLTG